MGCVLLINSLRPRQNRRHFPYGVFKCNFLNENVWIPIEISMEFVPRGPINNIPTLVQVMAWRRPGDKPLSEPTMVRLPTHICVTRPQWFNSTNDVLDFYFSYCVQDRVIFACDISGVYSNLTAPDHSGEIKSLWWVQEWIYFWPAALSTKLCRLIARVNALAWSDKPQNGKYVEATTSARGKDPNQLKTR